MVTVAFPVTHKQVEDAHREQCRRYRAWQQHNFARVDKSELDQAERNCATLRCRWETWEHKRAAIQVDVDERDATVKALRDALEECTRSKNPVPWMMAALLAAFGCFFLGSLVGVAGGGAASGVLFGIVLGCLTVPVPIVWYSLRRQRADKQCDDLLGTLEKADYGLLQMREELERLTQECEGIAGCCAETERRHQQLALLAALEDDFVEGDRNYQHIRDVYEDPRNKAELKKWEEAEQRRRAEEERCRREEEIRRRREEEERRRREHEERLRREEEERWQSARERRRRELLATIWRDLKGEPFVDFLQRVFEFLGYKVQRMPQTGDWGIDLILHRGGKAIGIQAKGWEKNVGWSAVQEAHAGCGFHGCHASAVITNSQFTARARKGAPRLSCRLICGDDIPNLICERISL